MNNKKNKCDLSNKFMEISGMNDYNKKIKATYMLNYGGILYDFESRGSLYIAIAVVLAPYYYKDGLKIESFITSISDIRELTLNEIKDARYNEIIKEFDSIMNKLKPENKID